MGVSPDYCPNMNGPAGRARLADSIMREEGTHKPTSTATAAIPEIATPQAKPQAATIPRAKPEIAPTSEISSTYSRYQISAAPSAIPEPKPNKGLYTSDASSLKSKQDAGIEKTPGARCPEGGELRALNIILPRPNLLLVEAAFADTGASGDRASHFLCQGHCRLGDQISSALRRGAACIPACRRPDVLRRRRAAPVSP
jgi:hypothetical protein